MSAWLLSGLVGEEMDGVFGKCLLVIVFGVENGHVCFENVVSPFF